MADASDRVIPATPRRREAARQQGAMPSAAVLAAIAMVATAILLVPGWLSATVPAAVAYLRASFTAAVREPMDAAPEFQSLLPLLVPTAAVVLASTIACLAVRAVLDGSAWRLGRAAPSWQRIDPRAGLARICSAQTLAGIVANGCGLLAVGAAACLASRPLVGMVAGADAAAGVDRWLGAARAFTLPTLAAATAVAAAQWGLSRLRFERRIRMTPEEFKEEMKSLEADRKVRLTRERESRSHTAR